MDLHDTLTVIALVFLSVFTISAGLSYLAASHPGAHKVATFVAGLSGITTGLWILFMLAAR